MGYFWPAGVSSRKELIAFLTEPSTCDYPAEGEDSVGRRVVWKTVAKCFRGRMCGVLWSVVERWSSEGEGDLVLNYRFIRCDLIRHDRDGWHYKPMSSSVHPSYFSCPESYLKMTEDYVSYCNEAWRAEVRNWHEVRRSLRSLQRVLSGSSRRL